MRKSLGIVVLAALLAGCGDKQASKPAPRAQARDALSGYSQGVRNYYGDLPEGPTGDEHADIELEYHQPPKPAEAGVGETITLTGTNIGVRLRVTVTRIERAGEHTAVHVKLENTGIAVYEAPLRSASLTFSGGRSEPSRALLARRARRACSATPSGSTSAARGPAACSLPATIAPSACSSRSRSCRPKPAGSGTWAPRRA